MVARATRDLTRGVIFHTHTKRIKQIGGGADRVRFAISRYRGRAERIVVARATRGFTGGIIGCAKRIKHIGGGGYRVHLTKPQNRVMVEVQSKPVGVSLQAFSRAVS